VFYLRCNIKHCADEIRFTGLKEDHNLRLEGHINACGKRSMYTISVHKLEKEYGR
jgi:hypothetical protein